MTKKHYLLKDVSKLLKLKPYQITYAISVGFIPEPALRINNKRVFVAEEVERIRLHFSQKEVQHV